MEHAKIDASTSTGLLFIGGFPSGGTDLVRSILNAHPEIHVRDEVPYLYTLSRTPYSADRIISDTVELARFKRIVSRIDRWNKLSISQKPLSAWSARLPLRVEDLLFDREYGNRIDGNKTPQYTEHLCDLHSTFPNAKFLIVIRDVRDVALSWRRKWAKDPFHCASKWARRMQMFHEYRSRIPENLLCHIRFEDLLDSPESVTRSLCAFLGVDWSENMMAHHRFIGERVDGKLNYGEPLKRDNKDKWRNGFSRDETARIESIAYNTMLLYGYTPEFSEGPRPLSMIMRMKGYVNDALAMVMVGNRAWKENGLSRRLRVLRSHVKYRVSSARLWF